MMLKSALTLRYDTRAAAAFLLAFAPLPASADIYLGGTGSPLVNDSLEGGSSLNPATHFPAASACCSRCGIGGLDPVAALNPFSRIHSF